MIEKADEIQRKIDVTKREALILKKQSLDVRVSKIEIDPASHIELMLEDETILQRFANELKLEEK